MNLRALRCRLTSAGDEPLDVSPWAGTHAALAERQPASAYLVGEDALAAFRRLPDLATDRGHKHGARPLSNLLLRQPRVPLVRAAFKSARQVSRSIRTLLEHAAALGEQKAYVVGIPRAVFAEFAARCGGAHDDEIDRRSAEIAAPEEMDPEEVPTELEARLTGNSPEMRRVRQWVVRAAREAYPVLVRGETGAGKEVVARSIHALNPARSQQPFAAINCGAIPQELFETDVFGYVPGAFSGALRQGSEGLWRTAGGGTVFLDEVGDLSPKHQVKLLRVLEEGVVRPVGGSRDIPVAARVVAASNRDLYAMTERGEFREDLYYRLAVLVINLPPLRDRIDDIAQLVALFWKQVAPRRPPLTSDVLRELQSYRWRGNARELRYVITQLHVTFPKSAPTVERLRAVVRMRTPDERQELDGDPEDAVRRVDHLRHLRRARAAIAAARRLAGALNRSDVEGERRIRLLTDVSACLSELQLLGIRPERFEKLDTFEDVHRLAGGLAAFQSLLARNDPDAFRYARKELTGEAAVAWHAVGREEARILKSL